MNKLGGSENKKKQLSEWKTVTAIGLIFSFGYYISITNINWLTFIGGIISIVSGFVYFISLLTVFVITAVKWRKLKFKLLLLNLIIVGTFSLVYFYRDGYFFGEKKLDAELIGDFGRNDLTLWQNHYRLTSSGMLSSKSYFGQYIQKGDTLILDRVADSFIPREMVIRGNMILFLRNRSQAEEYNFNIVPN
ncbi:hypothetical protein ACFSC6_04585 [Rufibacter sediminis]|uniref:Peptidase S26 domain-containing protein n=1 Tax=Rufibacter sediminis TaxID=2762756 RepID=A0ABR6VS33_9BACT|nr:hypothetical protein [Rufibacter sediminis]MBC3540001.1 hypothetical protein [Rufibacter sediminis]